MRNLLVLVSLLLAAFAPPAAAAQPATGRLPAPVARALAQAGIPETGVAVYVHEIGAERAVVAHGSDRPLNPASTMKLVTTYAALDLLGPAYAWNTEIYTTGTLQQGVLGGDLILKGYGDPKLTLENFWLLLRNLRQRGVREIRGDLVLDRSYFDATGYDPARFDDQPTRPYNTGPDALLVNFKAVTLLFVPDQDTRTVKILAEPALPQLTIINNLTLANDGCGDWVSRLRLDAHGNGEAARLTFNGAYSRDCGEKTRSFSVLGHRQYLAGLFAGLWKELGGTLTGSVRNGGVPPDAQLLASAKSEPLSEIVRSINKFSNNVMARQLFLTLGAAGAEPPGTFDKANQRIRLWLSNKGLSFPELVMENGSGLSRIARISARNLGQLLLSAYHSPVMPELMASLPLVAVDGTMKKRLNGADVAGQAHIKTGTLEGVRAIAGYVLNSRGRRVVVVFLVNHPNAGKAQPAQDALLNWIYHNEAVDCCRRQ
ncbi:MAG TPA: D-alanyl-D-alanine carboxypeptidase/D-alanyl-D-alanine-endopeptidase [Burkholderiales bacterium]|nr:D-alanyl-D-alanine carboxypeptidase/D-alanyl-D-alanine-endopeptidase [Burkholderiales bacterium]